MSADVQPRKRKDKKKKRDSLDSKSEGEVIARKLSLKDDEDTRESHHGVHATKMGVDDVHLHVQGDHSTGGHWCAKIFFFSLLAILLGLIGLIIIENRGLSDLDTPLSESRFSDYFEGWVDEHRQAHDDHEEKIPAELEDHDAEPFEEEEDHSEVEEDDEEHEVHGEHDKHDDADKDDEDQGIEEDDADEYVPTLGNPNVEDDDEVEEQNDDVGETEMEEDDDDENDDEEDDTNTYSRGKREINEDHDDIDEGFDENDADDDNNDNFDDDNLHQAEHDQIPQDSVKTNTEYEQDPYEEDDDDFESLETVVYNDAAEDLHLQQKAKQEQVQSASMENQEEQEEESSSEIKTQPSGGPQFYSEDDFIEEQLRKANEEMLQNQFNF